MNPFTKVAFAATALSVAVCRAQTAQVASPTKAAFSLTLSAAQSTVKTGQPQQLEVTLTNKTDHVIGINEDRAYTGDFYYPLTVRDEQSKDIPLTRRGRAIRGRPTLDDPPVAVNVDSFLVQLDPGHGLIDTINVTPLYDLTRPGRYSIQASRYDDVSKERVLSNVIDVTITP
ncbi:MAG TPA: hypothetical protein VGM27_08635 [Acidobacteriaceae bacterium]|jgi:hypothetical protein